MRTLWIVSLMMFLVALPVAAQDCPTLVGERLAQAGAACAGIEINEACYASGPVEATAYGEAQFVFGAPGDTIALDSLYSLRLGALLPDAGEWGLALLRVPAGDAGQEAFVLLIGNVEMRNTCSALLQQEVQLERETELRTGPGSQYSSLALLPVGTVLHVNACNCTGNWLRAVGPDQQVGWIWFGSIAELSDESDLPVVGSDAPVYGPMQAFCVRSLPTERPCPEAPEGGALIQASPELGPALLQINQIALQLTGTAFIQSQPGEQFSLEVLDGTVSLTLDGFTLEIPQGVRALVPLNADNQPAGPARLELFTAADVVMLPVELLPAPVDVTAALAAPEPAITGVEPCAVISGLPATQCRVHFVNGSAETIRSLEVEFVRAPVGDWSDSVHADPPLLDGDAASGVLAWEATCNAGSANFIGPVVWRLTLVDAQGQRSQPFEASFNCE